SSRCAERPEAGHRQEGQSGGRSGEEPKNPGQQVDSASCCEVEQRGEWRRKLNCLEKPGVEWKLGGPTSCPGKEEQRRGTHGGRGKVWCQVGEAEVVQGVSVSVE